MQSWYILNINKTRTTFSFLNCFKINIIIGNVFESRNLNVVLDDASIGIIEMRRSFRRVTFNLLDFFTCNLLFSFFTIYSRTKYIVWYHFISSSSTKILKKGKQRNKEEERLNRDTYSYLNAWLFIITLRLINSL